MLFDISAGRHETTDLATSEPGLVKHASEKLDEWTTNELARSGQKDPFDVVRREGGPYHVRRHLRPYLDRLDATGRERWAEVLRERHESEL